MTSTKYVKLLTWLGIFLSSVMPYFVVIFFYDIAIYLCGYFFHSKCKCFFFLHSLILQYPTVVANSAFWVCLCYNLQLFPAYLSSHYCLALSSFIILLHMKTAWLFHFIYDGIILAYTTSALDTGAVYQRLAFSDKGNKMWSVCYIKDSSPVENRKWYADLAAAPTKWSIINIYSHNQSYTLRIVLTQSIIHVKDSGHTINHTH